VLTAFMLKVQAEARRKVCDSCDQKRTSFGVDLCNKCGCVITFKVKLRESVCPLHKWDSIDAASKNTNPLKPSQA
jgi:ribosomal protein L37AE/L43A